MTSPSSWTDDRVDVLTKLWRDGKSASVIARELGGVTRNAVIGKVHRLGLSGRAKPARPGSRRPRTPRAERRLSRPRFAAVPTPAPTSPAPLAPAPETGLADMRSVGRHACRWPIGDPLAPGFSVCGRPVERGAYCALHGALAYRPTGRDHLLKLAGLA